MNMMTAPQWNAQQVLELAKSDDQGGCRSEAADHRMREEIHQEPKPENPQQELYPSDEQRQQNGHLQVGFRAAFGQGAYARGSQQRHHSHRTHGQLPGSAQQGVDE